MSRRNRGQALRVVPSTPEPCPLPAEDAPRTLRATTRVVYCNRAGERTLALPGEAVDPCDEDRECMLETGLAQ